jgi:hypothetical protein
MAETGAFSHVPRAMHGTGLSQPAFVTRLNGAVARRRGEMSDWLTILYAIQLSDIKYCPSIGRLAQIQQTIRLIGYNMA